MARHFTISKGQGEALHKFLTKRLDSVDEVIEEMGQDDAFKLFRLKARLDDHVKEKA